MGKIVVCRCGAVALLNEKYDAYYCEKCNMWVENKCPDKTCEFCSKRPDKPLEDEDLFHGYVH